MPNGLHLQNNFSLKKCILGNANKLEMFDFSNNSQTIRKYIHNVLPFLS